MDETDFVNATDLTVGTLIRFGGSDYGITVLLLTPELKVMIIVEPMECFEHPDRVVRGENELRFIVPQMTPITVLK